MLHDVSFGVPANGMTGFVGANGAGKTTTMRIIMGVLKAHGGQVLFNGEPLVDADRARFGYMPGGTRALPQANRCSTSCNTWASCTASASTSPAPRH